MLVLNQTGLINNILEIVGMYDCNTRGSPTKVTPLRTNANGPHRKDQWNYAYVIGILMYLSSNSYPDIKFAIYKCAWFIDLPQASRKEAIKHICR